MANPIVTAYTGKNRVLFSNIAPLYIPDGSMVADVTFGNGNFWKDIDVSKYNFHPSDLVTGTDFRNLPYPDRVFDVVVLDPPYMHGSGTPIISELDKTYRNNERTEHGYKAVNQLYYDGMDECHRVLTGGGLLMVKCQDQIESGKQCWVHIDIFNYATNIRKLAMIAEDLFVLVNPNKPMMRHPYQKHARKSHSYLWIFRK